MTGNPPLPTVGRAGTAIIRRISSTVAVRRGTLSKRKADARHVHTNGYGPHVCDAVGGLGTRIGTGDALRALDELSIRC